MTEKAVTRAELARITGLSTKTLDRRRREGMPFVVFGARSIRFYPSQCLPWLAHFGRNARSFNDSAGAKSSATVLPVLTGQTPTKGEPDGS